MIRKKFILLLSLVILSLLLASCYTSKGDMENQDEFSSDSVYVFDKPLPPPTPPPVDTSTVQPKEEPPTPPPPVVIPPAKETYYYVIQIGAFKSNERAQIFADSAKKEISNKIEISYSSRVNFYVVHLMPPYATKEAAQKAREELWKKNKFMDAWILTVRK